MQANQEGACVGSCTISLEQALLGAITSLPVIQSFQSHGNREPWLLLLTDLFLWLQKISGLGITTFI